MAGVEYNTCTNQRVVLQKPNPCGYFKKRKGNFEKGRFLKKKKKR